MAALNEASTSADRLTAQRNLMQAAEARAVFDLIGASGCRAMLIKGPAVAMLAYDDLSQRPFADLDILTGAEDLPKVRQILVQRGYISAWPAPARHILGMVRKEEPMRRDPPGIVIELHQHLTHAWRPAVGAFDELWSRRQIVAVAGASVPTLGMEDLIIYLCIHGTGHGWSRLKWVADIDGLVRRHSAAMDWRTLLGRARQWRVGRALRIGVLASHRLFATPFPDEVLGEARADPTADDLAGEAMGRLDDSCAVPRTPIEALLYRWRALERPADRMRFACHQLFVPTPREAAMWPLPRPLWPLYGLIRPGRLVLKYTVGRLFAR